MKKGLLILAILWLCWRPAFSQELSFPDKLFPGGISLAESDENGARITFSISSLRIETVNLDDEKVKKPVLTDCLLPNEAGAPDLPGSGRYIAIPLGSLPKLKATYHRSDTIFDIDIAPAPDIPADNDNRPLRYKKNPLIYRKDAFYPADPVKLSEPTRVRGVDAVIIGITPFRYNPVTRQLVVLRDLEIEITYMGGEGKFGEERYQSRWWDPVLEDIFMNGASLPSGPNPEAIMKQTADGQRQTGYEYLIICPNHPDFIRWADSIRAFRNMQGILTGIATTAQTGGNNAEAIESYIDNAYLTWDIPPAAVLLLGDHGSSGTTVMAATYNGYCASDHIYADVDFDEEEEIALARITARNAEELETMVRRFMDYEMHPPSSPSFYQHPVTALGWQTERWFQICSEAIGGYLRNVKGKEPIRINAVYGGDPGADPWTTTDPETILPVFGPEGLGYIPSSPQELGGWSGGTHEQVTQALNNGSYLVQHRDHGYEVGWGEPDYTVEDIGSLANTDLSYVFSINCLTGRYDWNYECFAEKFHRHTNNGQPSGALGILAASETSFSFVNDTYMWGVFDHLFPDFLPQYGTTPPSRGLMPAFANTAGKIFLKYSGWPYNEDVKEVTYNLYHHHGDAFMELYSEVPQELTVFHDSVLISGAPGFTVSADEGSLIALSSGGELLGIASGTGSPLIIPVDPLYPPALLDVVVTKTNFRRYHERLHVIPPGGPYIIYSSHSLTDTTGNGNGLADYGETVGIDLSIANIGNDDAGTVTVTASTTDLYASFIDSTQAFGPIPGGGVASVPGALSLAISHEVPDGHEIVCSLAIAHGDTAWTSSFKLAAHAPLLEFGHAAVNDSVGNSNGRIDPGETAEVTVTLTNQGSSAARSVLGSLYSDDPYLSIPDFETGFGDIGPGETMTGNFTVHAAGHTPGGHEADLDVAFTGDEAISAEGSFSLTIGRFPVLVIDLDPNHNSANKVMASIQQWNIGVEYSPDIPEYLSIYKAVFLCLGTYPQNHILSPSEAAMFISYLNEGGTMYMEGGDTWYFDQQYHPTSLHPMFNIRGAADGSDNLSAILGQPGTFTGGMIYMYTGDNEFIDHIEPQGNGYALFRNNNPEYTTVVANPSDEYRTIGSSLEFGGLGDNSSYTRKDLAGKYLDFFGFVPITDAPVRPQGIDSFCAAGEPSAYATSPVPGAEFYVWHLEPLYAGSVTGMDTAVTITWDEGFSGQADLTVRGMNDHCLGPPSDTLKITIHNLPTMTFGFLEDTICAGDTTGMTISFTGISPWHVQMMFGGLPITMKFNKPFSNPLPVAPTADLNITVLSLIDGSGCENTSLPTQTLHVNPLPGKPGQPAGPDTVLTSVDPFTSYAVSSEDALSYEWQLIPPGAGTIRDEGSETGTCTVDWNTGFHGTALVAARGFNACGEGDWSDTLSVAVGYAFGLPERSELESLTVYPNPSRGSFRVEMSAVSPRAAMLLLVSPLGETVYRSDQFIIDKNTTVPITLNKAYRGMYVLNLITEKAIFTIEVLIN